MRKILSLAIAALFSATMFATTWTVAGTPASVFGSEWSEGNTDNDMTLVGEVYQLVKENVTVPAGNVKFKVCKDHAWGESYPGSDYSLAIAEDGQYDITITFNESTKEVNATATKKGSAVIEKHYLVAGDADVVNGTGWNNANADNLMASSDGGLTYVLAIENLTLNVGTYEYKIVEQGSWTTYYPTSGNASFSIAERAIYTITYTYTVASQTCAVVATKTGEAGVYVPTAAAKGSWDNWTVEVPLVNDGSNETATGTIDLPTAKDYEFKIIIDGDKYRGNGYTYHRGFTGADGIENNGNNMVLTADVAGIYTITWTYATNAIQITFPTATGINDIENGEKAAKELRNGQLFIIKGEKTYNVLGQEVR